MDKKPVQPQKSGTAPEPVSRLWRVCNTWFSARVVGDKVVVRKIRSAK